MGCKKLCTRNPSVVIDIMARLDWTRAVFLRNPKERVLSAFLDKALGESYNGYYMRRCCREVQDLKRKEQCTAGKKDFSSFLHEANCCMDTHWEPHARKIDLK